MRQLTVVICWLWALFGGMIVLGSVALVGPMSRPPLSLGLPILCVLYGLLLLWAGRGLLSRRVWA
jgi:hypothetical protein